jgi:YegS/Rv2252/BmrU family lipid kinase
MATDAPAAPAEEDSLTLGVLPFGTGADFIRTLGIPRQSHEAIDVLKAGRRKRIDLGQVTYQSGSQTIQRYFANVVGLGFDAATVRRVNRSPKAIGGTLPFLTAVLIELFTYRNTMATVRFDGQELVGKVNAVVACNGRYFGGGMEIGPNAQMDDGLLDLIILGDLTRPELLANLPTIYSGSHLKHPKVQAFRARKIEIETTEQIYVEAEGEWLGQAPATIEVIPKALQVLA